MPEVRLVGVSKRFGDVVAVDHVDLEIGDGEYFSLLGPSGCGKTTTLRIIAGLVQPDEGEVYIDGRLVNDVPPEDRNVGFVFQHFEIFPFMTVFDNVAYPLRIVGTPEPEVEERVWKVLDMVELRYAADRYPRDLSAPELQKCGIARALVRGSKLLLLDEPLGALDPEVRKKFREMLRGLVKEHGLTAVHVTHDQEEAMAISDRIAIMRRGRIIQVGSPMELYLRPKTIFVANFMGETNFLEAIVVSSSEEGSELRLRGGIPIKVKVSYPEIGARVIVAVREEALKTSKEPFDANSIEGRAVSSAFLGRFVRHRVELVNGEFIKVREPSTSSRPYRRGERVYVYFPPSKMLVYPYPPDLMDELSLT